MIVKPLAASRIVLCASPEYLQRCGTPQSADDLLSHQTLIYEHVALDRRWRLSLDQQVFTLQPQGRLTSDNYDFLLAACLAGQGVLDCPHWSVQPLLTSGRLVQVLPDYQVAPDAFGPLILAMYPSHRRATRKVQAFIEFIEAYLRARQLA